MSRYERRPNLLSEGWLIKSRERGIRLPILKSKWVRRYYVIRRDDLRENSCILDEYKDDRKARYRKSIDLSNATQIESHLKIAAGSCAVSGGFALAHIFSVHVRRESAIPVELYFATDSDEAMSDWVYSLCRSCGLHDSEDQPRPPQLPRSPIPPRNDFSVCSLEASRAATPATTSQDDESTAAVRNNYQHLRNFHSPTTPQEAHRLPHQRSNDNGKNGDGSSMSSMASSNASLSGTEDDNSSLNSVPSMRPPIPPRVRPPQPSSVDRRGPSIGLNGHIPAPPPSSTDENDEHSSGETIKLRELAPAPPPPPPPPPAVDRSLKPTRHLPAIPKTTPRIRPPPPKTVAVPPPSSSTLEYLEASCIIGTGEAPRHVQHSSSDLDYMHIDASKTQAIKHAIKRNRSAPME